MTTTNSTSAVRDGAQRKASRPGWWRSTWIVPLAGYCLYFSGYAWYHYIRFDPDYASASIRDTRYHFILFALHVNLGAVAIAAAWMQVWPWLRNNHPKVHRTTGRIYFFLGVFPAGLLAFPNAMLSFSRVAGFALFVLALLWLGSGVAGLRATLQRRYEDHHRWMVRNVAMTTAIVSMRVINEPIKWFMTTFMPDSPPLSPLEVYGAAAWTAIITHLLVAEWFVLRPRRRRRSGRPQRPAPATANV